MISPYTREGRRELVEQLAEDVRSLQSDPGVSRDRALFHISERLPNLNGSQRNQVRARLTTLVDRGAYARDIARAALDGALGEIRDAHTPEPPPSRPFGEQLLDRAVGGRPVERPRPVAVDDAQAAGKTLGQAVLQRGGYQPAPRRRSTTDGRGFAELPEADRRVVTGYMARVGRAGEAPTSDDVRVALMKPAERTIVASYMARADRPGEDPTAEDVADAFAALAPRRR